MRTSKFFAVVVAIYISSVLRGQGTPISAWNVPNASDPAALTTVGQAIAALGGQSLWQQVGGATAQATFTPASGAQYGVRWSDDWSTGQVRFRRDTTFSAGNHSSLLGSSASQVILFPSGKTVTLRHDDGIAVLAMAYPAAALILSKSSKFSCTFHVGDVSGPGFGPKDTSSDGVIITEFCPDHFYPRGQAPLVWKFSSDGVPLSVRLPIWGQNQGVLHTQTVSYVAFQNVDGILTPAQLQIRRVSGVVDTLSISKTKLVSGLASSVFQMAQ
jgi:hypothetical protein